MDYLTSFLGYSAKEEKNTELDDQLNQVDFTEKDANNILTMQVNQALGVGKEPEEEDSGGSSEEENQSNNDQ